MIKQILSFIALLLLHVSAQAQESYNERVQKYIEQYQQSAIAEQQRSGVPASITLGQGILETEAGKSELVIMANNHFGIKCKSDWQGDKFLHDDDAPKECFKKYKSADESYKDHSDYLRRNPRYSPLFSLTLTDYAGWAIGLKKCGYATNPHYAQQLIKIIEDFRLQQYTYTALDSGAPKYMLPAKKDNQTKLAVIKHADTPKTATIITPTAKYSERDAAEAQINKDTIKAVAVEVKKELPVVPVKTAPEPIVNEPKKLIAAAKEEPAPNPTPAPTPLAPSIAAAPPQKDTTKVNPTVVLTDTKYDSGKVIQVNGLKAIYAYKGDMLLQYAVKYNIRYPHLLDINDLPDAPLSENMLIYLEKKQTTGAHAKHTVKEGESLLQIAQNEGIQLKKLLSLNMLDYGDEPAAGAILELQNGATRKPALRPSPTVPTNTMLGIKQTPVDTYVPVKHKIVDTAKALVSQKPIETQAILKAQPIKNTDSAVVLKSSEKSYVETHVVKPGDTTAKIIAEVKAIVEAKADTVDELAALKAELDKVVYNDNKDPDVKAIDTVIKEPIKISTGFTTPVPEKKEHINNSRKYYTVRKGDTMSAIAKRTGVSVAQIKKWNKVDPDELRPGQQLKVMP